MGSEWPLLKLENIAEVIDSRHKTPKYSDSGLPMVRVVDVKGGLLNLENAKKVSDDVYADFSKGRDPAIGDLIFSRVGSYGNVGYVGSVDKFCLGQNTALIIPTHKDRFLYYALLSPQVKQQIEQMVVGAVQKTISLKSIRSLEIPDPSETEREKIAAMLSGIDDRIDLNRQTNQTLEQMAQTLFKSWFVDFDPVIDNALAAGNPIPEPFAKRAEYRKALLDKTLPEEQRALFPSEFEETELSNSAADAGGWVPKGWKVELTSSISKMNSTSWTKKDSPDYVDYVDLSNAKNGQINEYNRYQFEDAPSRAKRKLKPHDSIIGLVRPGNKSYAYIHENDLTGSTGFAVMRPNHNNVRAYLYLHLTRDEVIDEFARLADGAAYPAIKPEVVANFECVIPADDVLDIFQSIVGELLDKIGKNNSANNSLSKLRDTLLPKLISGELRLPETDSVHKETSDATA